MVRGRDDRQLNRLMGFRAVQHLIFKGMQRAFHPERAGGFAAEVQYELKGSTAVSSWLLRIADGQVKATPGRATNPLLTFRMTLPTFARIAAGELNAVTAMLEHRLEVDGDVKKLAKFSELFLDR
jgi:putative sterol carrier protein